MLPFIAPARRAMLVAEHRDLRKRSNSRFCRWFTAQDRDRRVTDQPGDLEFLDLYYGQLKRPLPSFGTIILRFGRRS